MPAQVAVSRRQATRLPGTSRPAAGRPPPTADVVIVGGGIAGGALATALARAGLSVVVLERSRAYRDLVRGESIVPWGVREVIRLGLLDPLIDAGGHWVTHWVSYDEGLDPREAERRALALDSLIPGVPGSLNVAHPVACAALRTAAEAAGARYLTGVRGVRCQPGPSPRVGFSLGGRAHEVGCRLIVGADGRTSVARKALRPAVLSTPPPHLVSGLLVKGLDGIWAEAEVQAVERDIYFLGMPQKDGWARVYLSFPLSQRERFAGPEAARAFLEAARCGCMPLGDNWAAGVAAGPCATFTAEDLWPASPVGEGLVLVGDAAGYVNPLIGQGLASAFYDVRVVAELMLEDRRWSPSTFAPYVHEREERFARVSAIGRLFAAIFADFSAGATERRQAVAERLQEDPMLVLPFAAMFAGPENVPSLGFVLQAYRRLLGRDDLEAEALGGPARHLAPGMQPRGSRGEA